MNKNNAINLHNDLANKWIEKYNTRSFSLRYSVFKTIFQKYVHQNDFWLDAGCGPGILSKEITDYKAGGIGIDAASLMIEVAKKRYSDINFTFKEFELVDKINMSNHTFDGVLCSSLLEYLPCPNLILKEFARVLKKDGYLIISVPNKLSLVRILQKCIKKVLGYFGINIFEYLKYSKNSYSKSEFISCVKKNDFKLLECISYNPFFKIQVNFFLLPSLYICVFEKQ